MKALLRRIQKLEKEIERLEAENIVYQLVWVNPETGEETSFD